jgi:hypothetical protein
MEEDDSRPGPTDNSDKVSEEELQSSALFHCPSATRITNKPVFAMKATYQWVLHGLVGTFQYKVRCKWERHTKQ